jgi:hypothetical protein
LGASSDRTIVLAFIDVCSISWGSDEANWQTAGQQAGLDYAGQLNAAAQAATNAGMIVFAASGDNDRGRLHEAARVHLLPRWRSGGVPIAARAQQQAVVGFLFYGRSPSYFHELGGAR